MHTLLLLAGLVLSWAALAAFSWLGRHRSRRVRVASCLALLSLLPLSSLTIATETFLMVDKECFGHSARWDQILSIGASTVVLAYFGWMVTRTLERRFRLLRVVEALPETADPRIVAALGRMGSSPLRDIRVLPLDRPVAFLVGWRHPVLALSDWLLDNLDGAELEAVLAHEIAHAQRQDMVVVGLAALWARFIPLKQVRVLHDTLTTDIEIAADEAAAQRTGRPLALASALARFWAFNSDRDLALSGVPQLGGSRDIERRITRLMAPTLRGPVMASWDLTRAATATITITAIVVVVLGIIPFWQMTHDHSLLCTISVPFSHGLPLAF